MGAAGVRSRLAQDSSRGGSHAEVGTVPDGHFGVRKRDLDRPLVTC